MATKNLQRRQRPQKSGGAKKEGSGMSTGAKVAIVMVAGLAVGAGIYFFKPGGAGNEKIAELLPEKTEDKEESKGKGESKGGGKETPAGPFPLRRGSRGKEVEALQKWLGIKTNTYGNFLEMTEAALLKKTGKKTMDESEYLFSVAKADPTAPGGFSEVFDPKKAADLVRTELGRNFPDAAGTLKALARIKNAKQYEEASAVFRQSRAPKSLTAKSIVTAVFDQWPDNAANKTIREKFTVEFLMMGLKYNGYKWSLGCLPPANRLMGI